MSPCRTMRWLTVAMAASLPGLALASRAHVFFTCGNQTYSSKPKACSDGSLPVVRARLSPKRLQAKALYDAVAVDDSTLKFGVCFNAPSVVKAQLCALRVCTRKGGAACRSAVHGQSKGGYGAVAIGLDSNTGKAFVEAAWEYKTVDGADQMARRGCASDEGIQKCKLRAHWYEGRPGIYQDGR